VPNPLPQMGSPSRPQTLGGPETYSGIETAHLGSRQNLLYSGASRAGAALARRPPLLPHLPPKLPAPTREQFFSGGYGRGGHSPAAPAGAGSVPAPLGDHPSSDGTHAQTRPLVPRRFGPALTQPLYKMTLETLHKHLETRLKIMVHHPKIYKTSKELILHSIKHRRLGEGDRRH